MNPPIEPRMGDTESVFGRLRTRARQEEHEQGFYVRMLQQHFRPGMRWLDAGCGHSLIPAWLKGGLHIEQKFLTEAEMIVGADVDSPSLAAPSPIHRVACRLENLGFKDQTFDLITCNMVVEHLAEPAKTFSEFFRVLRPRGIAIILTPNIYHWANIVSMLTPFSFHRLALKRLWNQEPEDVFPTLYRCNNRFRMQTLLRAAGFSNIEVHMVPGRQRLIEFGPLFYPEYVWHWLSLRLDNLREILCAVAQKAGNAESRPVPNKLRI
jgi:ubiquinone/menaquinone biosynthesis C-methylase UbiE